MSRLSRLGVGIGQEFFHDRARDRLAKQALNRSQLLDFAGRDQ